MASDPFAYADQFYQTQVNTGEAARNRAQQALLSIFREEIARQNPMVELPVQLAAETFSTRNMEPFKEAAAARQRRYGAKKETKKDEEQEEAASSSEVIERDGRKYLIVDGVEYPM